MNEFGLNIPVEQMGVEDSQFNHQSTLHGQGHVNRVIMHTLVLVKVTGRQDWMAEHWAAAYLHDLGRKHDEYCEDHGRWSIEDNWNKYLPFLEEAGVKPERYAKVIMAVAQHCLPDNRCDLSNPVLKLLKDADGLDRVRLGDFDRSYLRLPESAALCNFAEMLFAITHENEKTRRFGDMTEWMNVLKVASFLIAKGALQVAKKPEKQHDEPCRECPFARTVTPGATGGSDPEVYVGQGNGAFWLPCHMCVDFSDPNWKTDLRTPQCAGAAKYRANIGKVPESNFFLKLPPDTDKCFANPVELLMHHRQISREEAEEILRKTPPDELTRQAMAKPEVVTSLVEK
jgi:hypothetical protein